MCLVRRIIGNNKWTNAVFDYLIRICTVTQYYLVHRNSYTVAGSYWEMPMKHFFPKKIIHPMNLGKNNPKKLKMYVQSIDVSTKYDF